MRTLKPKFKGKLIYVTPGAGKTTAVENNIGVIDSDVIMAEVMKSLEPDFKMLPNETIQDFIYRYTLEFNNKTKVNNRVIKRANELIIDNYTVLTGTLKIAKEADYVFVAPPNNKRIQNRFGSYEEALNWHINEIDFLNIKKIHFEILNTQIEDRIFK